jgi:4-amino-4-deoxy-L-arabinose transferase-like glycosyltransferase
VSHIPTNSHTLRHRSIQLWALITILLIATAFRFAAPYDSPPGWRDDELIEFDMDVRIRDGWRPLYITEAEGHEPLYHYLHAATIGLFGENVVGYRWLPMAFGVLTVALTYALARRLFDTRVALVAAALMAVSFWPIMYARLGVRQIGLLPWMLGAYLILVGVVSRRVGGVLRRRSAHIGDSPLRSAAGIFESRLLQAVVGGLCLAAGLLTYFAGRVAPVVVVIFAAYLLLWHREVFKSAWINILIVLAAGAVLAAPMFVEINRLLPGGEQRLDVVGPQLNELLKGNLQPAVETAIGTLGMFTIRGDPEALYNVEGRPVFDWLTGVFLYMGLAVSIWRWKRIEYAFTLIAFGLGIAPAFVSNPPASFSHTVAAMPLVYVLAGLGLAVVVDKIAYRLGRRPTTDRGRKAVVVRLSSFVLIIVLNAGLIVRDYFGVWAQDSYVRFLYHAPTRQIAQWLDETPEVRDVAIATHPNYMRLDPLALNLDLKRDDVHARWFDAETALVRPAGQAVIIGTTMNAYGEDVANWRACCGDFRLMRDGDGFDAWEFGNDAYWNRCSVDLGEPTFDNRLSLLCPVAWHDLPGMSGPPPPDELWIDLVWRTERPGLPSTLKTFVHLVDANGDLAAQFDGMGVYLPSLRAGDRFIQFVRLPRPANAPGPLSIRIGLYDSATDTRLLLPDMREFVTIDLP